MRKKLVPVFLLLAFVGCTSLLGDFEVGSGPPDGGGGDGAVACVDCSGKCVDITTDPSNCGACGVACAGGKTCQASACACPVEQAFCGGQCVKADRTHCGEACTACQADELCGTSCVPAPAPDWELLPPNPAGWVDAAGKPLEIKIRSTGVPGTLYECRTGLISTFTPSEPPWKPCDGGDGKTPVHRPTAAGQPFPDGTFRTEYRYRSDTFRSPTIAHDYYVLHALDRVPTCPRPGMPADGPHFSDAQYFQAATEFATRFPGSFTVADLFEQPGQNRGEPFYLKNPWIKIPFKQIKPIWPLKGGDFAQAWPSPGAPWPSQPFDYTLHERSLRHKFVLSPQRNLLLVRRQYINPVKRDCRNDMVFGSEGGAAWGPNVGFARGPKHLDCEALVLNVHGMGLCMGSKPDGSGPAPQAVDKRTVQDQPGTGTVSGVAGGTRLTGGAFNAAWVGKYVQLPQAGIGYPGLHWFKITAFDAVTRSIEVAPPLMASVTNAGYRYFYGDSPNDIFIAPTAFAKLSEMPRRYAPPLAAPSPNTKCEDRAAPYDNKDCAVGKPWLTYLPP